jgi:hypothetical protein
LQYLGRSEIPVTDFERREQIDPQLNWPRESPRRAADINCSSASSKLMQHAKPKYEQKFCFTASASHFTPQSN